MNNEMDDMAWEEAFDECLDECNPIVKIGSLEYNPSWVLKQIDPTAYRIGLSEYRDALEEEE